MNKDKIHYLKTWPEYFGALWDGQKCFELRSNDRDYHVGDILLLQEYDPQKDFYSGRAVRAKVTFMVQGVFGLPNNLCIMSLAEMDNIDFRHTHASPPQEE